MNFVYPEYLWALVLVIVVYCFYHLASKKRKHAAIKFSHLAIVKKASKKVSKKKLILFYVNLLVLVLLIVAIADPMIPLKRTKKGVNLVLAIDVSGSMQATDYKPNRLEAAKKSAVILINKLDTNDLAGIVIFADGATTASYFTSFKDRTLDKLKSIQPKQGRTAIGDGLSLAVDMVTSIPNKKKVVILLSDGVNNAGVITPDEGIQFAKSQDIQVFTIGMGSAEKVVLGYDWFGNPQYAELDEATLKRIAFETDAEYYKSVDDSTLQKIYKQLSEKIKREKEDTSIKDWFILGALIVMLAGFYLRYGKGSIIQ